MQINWKKYVRLARDKDLSSSQLAQVIRKETHQRVHISEVRRQLFTGGFEETASGNGSASEVSIIDLSEASDICQRTLIKPVDLTALLDDLAINGLATSRVETGI